MEAKKKFQPADLNKFTDKNGKIYLAVNGNVYDVSDSDLWEEGEHMGLHRAGGDLTAEMDEAPHGLEVLEKYPVVGELE